MNGKIKKTTGKYVTENTFEKHMRAIAKSLNALQEQATAQAKLLGTHGEAINTVIGELKNLHEDNKKMRDTLSSFISDVLMHDRKIENLTVRVEKLEVK